MIKAFASDIDGTLVFDGKIKSQDKQAITAFQKDHLFGVCSGRPLCGLKDIENIHCDFYILSSGALILDKNKQIIHHHPIDINIVEMLFNTYKPKAKIIIQTGNPSTFYSTLTNTLNSFTQVKQETIYGISFIFDDEPSTLEVLHELDRYPHIKGYQNLNSIDIVSDACSKGEGVRFIKEYYSIDTLYGIGDSYNDLPLFETADYAFTFNSSPDELKQNVDECIDSLSEAINKVL